MPARPIEFRPEARAEVRDAYDYYEQANPFIADRFLDQLDQLLIRIGENPNQFPRYSSESEMRVALIAGFPYFLVLREWTDNIEVLAVCHAKRKPEYWQDRLS